MNGVQDLTHALDRRKDWNSLITKLAKQTNQPYNQTIKRTNEQTIDKSAIKLHVSIHKPINNKKKNQTKLKQPSHTLLLVSK